MASACRVSLRVSRVFHLPFRAAQCRASIPHHCVSPSQGDIVGEPRESFAAEWKQPGERIRRETTICTAMSPSTPSRHTHAHTLPMRAAQCTGVLPLRSTTFASALCVRRSFTASEVPTCAATQRMGMDLQANKHKQQLLRTRTTPEHGKEKEKWTEPSKGVLLPISA